MEIIDVFNENNEPLNYTMTRDEVHEKNLWHRHASGWIMNKKGEILLQKRAKTKKKNPGIWSKTGGHVDSGESPIEAVKREIKEEIGIDINDSDLELTNIYKSEGKDHYFSYGYVVFVDKKVNEFVLQEDEVEEVKYYTIEELEELKRNKDENYTFYKWEDDDFYRQMNELKIFRGELKK